MKTRLLFLDRDGTLNRSLGQRPPNTPDEVELFPGVGCVLSRYVEQGWRLVIVTNQGGVARGYLSEAEAYAVLRRVVDLLPVPVTATYLCPHMVGAPLPAYDLDCPNRKPRPGFLLAALASFAARPTDCLFVGDAITDRQAAEAAGVPFCWADRTFGRPIDRGMQTDEGAWFQVREEPAAKGLQLTAAEGAQPIGRLTLALMPQRDTAAMDLFVDTSHRRMGVGRALLQTALDWAQGQRLRALDVCAGRKDDAAIAFLRRSGFVRADGDLFRRTLDLGGR